MVSTRAQFIWDLINCCGIGMYNNIVTYIAEADSILKAVHVDKYISFAEELTCHTAG